MTSRFGGSMSVSRQFLIQLLLTMNHMGFLSRPEGYGRETLYHLICLLYVWMFSQVDCRPIS